MSSPRKAPETATSGKRSSTHGKDRTTRVSVARYSGDGSLPVMQSGSFCSIQSCRRAVRFAGSRCRWSKSGTGGRFYAGEGLRRERGISEMLEISSSRARATISRRRPSRSAWRRGTAGRGSPRSRCASSRARRKAARRGGTGRPPPAVSQHVRDLSPAESPERHATPLFRYRRRGRRGAGPAARSIRAG